MTKFRFMGDTLVATPFLASLRRYLPQAEITLLTSPSAAIALAHCPSVDRVLAVQQRGQGRWQHSRKLLSLLRGGRYELAFLLNRSFHSGLMARLAAIPIRIGYANELRRPLLTVPVPYHFDRHESDCHLDLLRVLGLPVHRTLPELWLTREEQIQGQAILREWGGQDYPHGRPWIAFQPGANDPAIREWGAERYARVAHQLLTETGGTLVLMGDKSEQETARRMAQAMRSPVLSLVGELSLREALAVTGQCDLWVGNDTGLLHAAVGLGVASVGIFGPNKVARWGYQTPRHRSLAFAPDGPVRHDAAIRFCLDAISEAEVLEAARAVQQSREPGERADVHTSRRFYDRGHRGASHPDCRAVRR